MITVRIPLAQQYAYIEATFDSTVEVNEQDLYDLVARLDDAAPKQEPPAYTPRNDADRAPAERRQAPPARGGQRPPTARGGTGLYCPEHKVEVMKTAAKYDRDGDKYYHPLPESEWYRLDDGRTVKNCNTYERLLVGPDQVGF